MAEGARFELADPLRGLRFSRPARSAAPSPLRYVIALESQYVPQARTQASCLDVAPGLRIQARMPVKQLVPLVGHRGDGHGVCGLPETGASIYRA
jgi:hypothetical protein